MYGAIAAALASHHVMWPESCTRRHKWIEVVLGSRLPGFFLGSLFFKNAQKTNTCKCQFNLGGSRGSKRASPGIHIYLLIHFNSQLFLLDRKRFSRKCYVS